MSINRISSSSRSYPPRATGATSNSSASSQAATVSPERYRATVRGGMNLVGRTDEFVQHRRDLRVARAFVSAYRQEALRSGGIDASEAQLLTAAELTATIADLRVALDNAEKKLGTAMVETIRDRRFTPSESQILDAANREVELFRGMLDSQKQKGAPLDSSSQRQWLRQRGIPLR